MKRTSWYAQNGCAALGGGASAGAPGRGRVSVGNGGGGCACGGSARQCVAGIHVEGGLLFQNAIMAQRATVRARYQVAAAVIGGGR